MSEAENSVDSEALPKATQQATAERSREERQWAMFCHLAGILGLAIPAGGVIATLILWQVKKDQWAFVDDQGKEAFNFQITVLIAAVVAAVSLIFFIGILLLPLVLLGSLIFMVLAGIAANEGRTYRYPLTLRIF